MSARVRISLAAAFCALTTACAVAPLFSAFTWFAYALFTVLAVSGAMLLARLAGVPEGLVPVVGMLALVLLATAVFGDGTQLLLVLPDHAALVHAQDLVSAARTDIRQLATPVPAREGLLLLLVGGVGVITLLIDLLSVSWRHPAVVGLPIVVVVSLASAIAPGGIGWLAFVVIAIGYLTLLVAEGHSRMLRWGRPFADQDDDSWEPEKYTGSPVGQAGRRIGATALGIALVLPIAFPFVTGGGLSSLAGHGDLGQGGSGKSSQVINPITTLKGQLTQERPTELLRVRTSDPDPFYLRLTTLDQYTINHGWSQGVISAPASAQVSRGLPDPGYSESTPVQKVQSSITVTGLGASQYLPAYLAPTKVSVKGDWRYDARSGTIFTTRTNARDTTYTTTSQSLALSDALTSVLGQAPSTDAGTSEGDDPAFLAAPSDPRIQSIVARIEKGQSTTYDKALALWRYFRGPSSSFTYSLSTKPGSTGDDLLDFLTNKQGYCEQYASAMAIMARYAGLPARVAIGFTKGVKKGKYWSITTADAHAWVEIYFADVGWVPWDPTPLATGGRATALPYATASDSSTANGTGGGLTGGGSSGSTGGTQSGRLGSKLQTLQDRDARSLDSNGIVPDLTPPPVPPKPDRAPWYVAGLVVLLLLLLIAPVGRFAQRRRRLTLADRAGPDAAYAAWDEVLASARDVGMTLEEAESARVTAARIGREGVLEPAALHALQVITSSVERASYAHTAEPVEGLAAAVRTVRRGLVGDSDRVLRTRASLLPASTVSDLGRAVLRFGDAAVSAVDGVPRWLARRRPRREAGGTT